MLNNGYLASASHYIDLTASYYGGDKRILIWNPYTGELASILSGHEDFVTYLELLNNGLLVSGSKDTTIKVWNTTDASLVATLIGHTSLIRVLKVLSNGNLASCSYDETLIYVWNTITFKLLFKISGHVARVYDVNNLDFNKPKNRFRRVDFLQN